MKTSRWNRASAAGAAAAIVIVAGTTGSALANDNCIDAIAVTPGTYMGTTIGATHDGEITCVTSTGPDVWYKITPTEDATLQVDLCGSSYDSTVAIFTGCPGDASTQIACNDDNCGLQSRTAAAVAAGETYYIRVGGYSANAGNFVLNIGFAEPPPPGTGPDVVYSAINGYSNHGAVGGVRAYTYGTNTCNIGNVDLSWTNGGTPGIGFNLYRLHEGRMMQLGQSWVKIACCAAAGDGCGLGCNGNGGSVLGAGCLDVYGSGWNANQGTLRPRSQVNPWTGQFGSSPGGSFNQITRRTQVQTSDLQLANFPGARYFAEGVYVATDEGVEKKMNNASHQQVNVNQSTYELSNTPGFAMRVGRGAIDAWRDHGLGLNTPDTSVIIQDVDVPEEGRFVVGHKVSDNGDGTWRYEYAVFNLNSHRSGGSFSVPVGEGVTVSNVGFHDVDYHSGEPYDNTDWSVAVGGTGVTWSSPQTFDQNANSNALRWGTMYNFWFDADAAPADAAATLGLFRPGTPEAVAVTVGAPAGGGVACPADWNDDEVVNSGDISSFLTAWLASVQAPDLAADFNADGVTNSGDISAFLTAWLDAVTEGC